MKTVIFDMDGCIIDSSSVQKKAFFDSYQDIVGDDKCPSYEEYMKHTGNSIDNVIKEMGLPLEMADRFRQISRESVNFNILNVQLIEVIKRIKSRGYKTAIVTGKDRYRAIEVLEFFDIAELFDCIIGADDINRPKPAPDGLLLAMKTLNVSRNEIVYLGDGMNDMICAKAAGVQGILCTWYGTNVESMDDVSYVVNSVKHFESLLLELG